MSYFDDIQQHPDFQALSLDQQKKALSLALDDDAKQRPEFAEVDQQQWSVERDRYVDDYISQLRSKEKEDNYNRDGDFVGGLKQGIEQTKGLLGGAVGLAGDLVGADSVRDWGYRKYKENMADAELHGGRVQRVEDIEGFGDAVDWFQGVIGSQLPMIASMAISGGVSGALAKKALQGAARKAVEKQVSGGVAKEIAEKAVKEKIIRLGTNVGIAASAGALEGGGMYGEDADKRGIDKANAVSAAGLGAVSGISELFSPVQRIASGVFPKVKGGILRTVAENAAGESAQEVFQGGISNINDILNDPNKSVEDMFNDEAVSGYINDAAAAAVIGGGFGVAGHYLGPKEAKDAPPETTIGDPLQEEADKLVTSGTVKNVDELASSLGVSRNRANSLAEGAVQNTGGKIFADIDKAASEVLDKDAEARAAVKISKIASAQNIDELVVAGTDAVAPDAARDAVVENVKTQVESLKNEIAPAVDEASPLKRSNRKQIEDEYGYAVAEAIGQLPESMTLEEAISVAPVVAEERRAWGVTDKQYSLLGEIRRAGGTYTPQAGKNKLHLDRLQKLGLIRDVDGNLEAVPFGGKPFTSAAEAQTGANQAPVTEAVEAGGAPPVKEPWTLTKREWRADREFRKSIDKYSRTATAKEYMNYGGKVAKQINDTIDIAHMSEVQAAIRAGKPVPKSVLADYPEFASEVPAQSGLSLGNEPPPQQVLPTGKAGATDKGGVDDTIRQTESGVAEPSSKMDGEEINRGAKAPTGIQANKGGDALFKGDIVNSAASSENIGENGAGLTPDEADTLAYVNRYPTKATIPNAKNKPIYDSLADKGLISREGEVYRAKVLSNSTKDDKVEDERGGVRNSDSANLAQEQRPIVDIGAKGDTDVAEASSTSEEGVANAKVQQPQGSDEGTQPQASQGASGRDGSGSGLVGSDAGKAGGKEVGYNPFREKAERAKAKYQLLSGPTSQEQAMAQSFPLGAGFGRGSQRSRDKRIDSSVNRAVKAVEAKKEYDRLSAYADAYDRGEITPQGRRVVTEKELQDRAEQKKKESAAKRALPLRNSPQHGTPITSEEWRKTHADYKAVSASKDGTYKYRSMIIDGGLSEVFLSDKKVVDPKPSRTDKDFLTVENNTPSASTGKTADEPARAPQGVTSKGGQESNQRASSPVNSPVVKEQPSASSEQADKPAELIASGSRQDESIVEHTTKRGKVLRGVIRTDLSRGEAIKLDNFTFKKDGGWFIRVKNGETPVAPQTTKVESSKAEKPKVDKDAVSRKRLRDTAEKNLDAAEQKLNQDRNTNTARRARMAGSAEADARASIKTAKTILNIVAAQEDGTAGPLAGITNKAQVETLEQLLTTAKYAEERKKDYGKQDLHRPATKDDAKNVNYPYPHFYDYKDLDGLIDLLGNKKGWKAKRNELRRGGLWFKSDDKLSLLRDALKLAGDDYRFGTINDQIKRYDRLQRAGINDQLSLFESLNRLLELSGDAPQKDRVKELERALVGQKTGIDFFPTPKAQAAEIVSRADIQPGMKVLEPSAGTGNLAEEMRNAGGEVDVAEISSAHREILEAKGFKVVEHDFMDLSSGGYDRIVMNPPFSNNMDIDHVQKAYELLKPGGKLVSIMGEGAFFRSGKKETAFREWLDSVGTSEKLPEGFFTDKRELRTTGVNARVVEIEKPYSDLKNSESTPPRAPADIRAELTTALGRLRTTSLLRRGAVNIVASQDEARGIIEGLGSPDVEYSVRKMPAPKKTVKAYKLFRVDRKHPGKLFPLFVDANTPVEIGTWLDAEAGELTSTGKVKSKLGPLAYRPGWHAGDLPIATHIGSKASKGDSAPSIRPSNQVWAEVELAADIDWQKEANSRGVNAKGKVVPVKAHITDQVPVDGFYRYKTNPNMTGTWLISGSMKVNRILTDKEVEQVNNENGVSDLVREEPFNSELYGFVEVMYAKDGKTIAGFSADGKIYLIADGIEKGQVEQVFNHEVVHATMLHLRKQETFEALTKHMLSKKGDQTKEGEIIRAAIKRAEDADVSEENFAEEVMAYAVELGPKVGVVRRFIAMFKKAMIDLFGNAFVARMTLEDVIALAKMSGRRSGTRAVAGDVMQSVKRGLSYPLAARGEWWGDADYTARGGKLVYVSPDEFLSAAKPLEMDELAEENIEDLIDHIKSGRTLDPLVLNGTDKTNVRNSDGRHRANAAKKLGIKKIPVIDYTGTLSADPRIHYSIAQEVDTATADPKVVERAPNKPDISLLQKILSSPEYYFREFPAAWKMYQRELTRHKEKYELEQSILGDYVAFMKAAMKNTKEAYKRANDYILDTDRTGKGFRLKHDTVYVATLDGEEVARAETVRDLDATIDDLSRKSSRDKSEYKTSEGDEWTVVKPNGKFAERHADEKQAVKGMLDSEADQMREEGFGGNEIAVVMRFRAMTNNAFDEMIADLRQIIKDTRARGLPEPEIDLSDEERRFLVKRNGREVASFRTSEDAWAAVKARRKADIKSAVKEKGPKVYTVVEQTDEEIIRKVKLSELIAQMGDMRGTYFPRQRNSGAVILRAEKGGKKIMEKFDFYMIGKRYYDKDGVEYKRPIIEGAKKAFNKATGSLPMIESLEKRKRQLESEGYKITISRDTSMPESVFEAGKLIASVDALLQESSKRAKGEELDKEVAEEVNRIISANVAQIVKERGFLSSRIARSNEYWEGFETDLLQAGTQYAKGLSSGIAKRNAARDMFNIVLGRDIPWHQWKEENPEGTWGEYDEEVKTKRIDPAEQKNLHREVMDFLEYVLRNEEQMDRVIGTLRGLAVVKFLGFRVSSAAVNATNLLMAVPATISAQAGKGGIGRALLAVKNAATIYGRYRSGIGTVSDEDRQIFLDISARGWDQAQFNHENAEVLMSKVGKHYSKFAEMSMYMFGAVEKANRATTIFAAYKELRRNTALNREDALQRAKEISDDAHGTYVKGTTPAWARGNVLRMTYTFQKFMHNYLLNMAEMGAKGDYKELAYMLLSPVMFGGIGSTLVTPVAVAVAKMMGFGDDPEEELYSWAEKTFGSDAAFRHGLPGLIGVNLKGSIDMNIPMPRTTAELLGAPGALFTDAVKGAQHIGRGEFMKAGERLLPTAFGSAIKATREGTEGVSTGSYSPVFYGDEPLKADTYDQFLRFWSFNPSGLSGIREKQWHEKEVKAKYDAARSKINAKIKRYYIYQKGDYSELMREISEYNEKVVGSGREDITKITRNSIKAMVRSALRPNKTERLRN